MTVKEVAAYYDVSKSTVYLWMKNGWICFKKGARAGSNGEKYEIMPPVFRPLVKRGVNNPKGALPREARGKEMFCPEEVSMAIR